MVGNEFTDYKIVDHPTYPNTWLCQRCRTIWGKGQKFVYFLLKRFHGDTSPYSYGTYLGPAPDGDDECPGCHLSIYEGKS